MYPLTVGTLVIKLTTPTCIVVAIIRDFTEENNRGPYRFGSDNIITRQIRFGYVYNYRYCNYNYRRYLYYNHKHV